MQQRPGKQSLSAADTFVDAANAAGITLAALLSCAPLHRVLWFLQGANAAELQSVRGKAAEAIVDFVRFPDQYQFDLLEADAVVQLQKDPESSALYQLLSTMLRSASIKVWLQRISVSRYRCEGAQSP